MTTSVLIFWNIKFFFYPYFFLSSHFCVANPYFSGTCLVPWLACCLLGTPWAKKKNATLLCPKYKRIFARLIKSFVSLVRWRSFLWHLSPLLFPDEPRLSGCVGLASVLSSGRQYQARINIMESHPRSHEVGVVWGLLGQAALLFWIEVSYISRADLGWNGLCIRDAWTLTPYLPVSSRLFGPSSHARQNWE